jgi:hypothetical protein
MKNRYGEAQSTIFFIPGLANSLFMSNLFHGSLKKIKPNNKYSYLEYFLIENNTLMGPIFMSNLFHIPLAPLNSGFQSFYF